MTVAVNSKESVPCWQLFRSPCQKGEKGPPDLKNGGEFGSLRDLMITSNYYGHLAYTTPFFLSTFRYRHIPLQQDRDRRLSDTLNVK